MSSKLFFIYLSYLLFAKVILQTEDYENEEAESPIETSNDDETTLKPPIKKTVLNKNPFDHQISVNNYMMETRLANDLISKKNARRPLFNFNRKRSNYFGYVVSNDFEYSIYLPFIFAFYLI